MFPSTEWQRLEVLRRGTGEEKRIAFDELFRRYREPVLGFLRRRGQGLEQAEDLAQDFFVYCLAEGVFEKADPSRGRFRNLMLTALQRYAANQRRHGHAQMRHPNGCLVSTDTAGPDGTPLDVVAGEGTPETEFQRGWARALLDRVLIDLGNELSRSGRAMHFEIFSTCVVRPALEGAPVPARAEL